MINEKPYKLNEEKTYFLKPLTFEYCPLSVKWFSTEKPSKEQLDEIAQELIKPLEDLKLISYDVKAMPDLEFDYIRLLFKIIAEKQYKQYKRSNYEN